MGGILSACRICGGRGATAQEFPVSRIDLIGQHGLDLSEKLEIESIVNMESEILWRGECSDSRLVLVREHSVELWKYDGSPDHPDVDLRTCVLDAANPCCSLTVSLLTAPTRF